ncbi:MAG: GHKL domain-containing protein, partial [Lachnospiraceae bacterium]|nr:GHKL domain-containing protein [Lachnospiraceae bacterium]
KLRKKGDRYLSTHKGGNGIGLISIAATAARYDGTAEFSHDEGVFYSEVMLVNKPTVEITCAPVPYSSHSQALPLP